MKVGGRKRTLSPRKTQDKTNASKRNKSDNNEKIRKDLVTKKEYTDDDSDVETLHPNTLSEYELNRLQNIRKNEQMLMELNLFETKRQVDDIFSPKQPVKKRGLIRPKKAQEEPLPRRQSLRILGKKAETVELPYIAEVPVDEHPRKPSGPLDITPANEVDNSMHKNWLQNVASLSLKGRKKLLKISKDTITDNKQYEKKIRSLKLTEEHVVKVVPERIFSIAVHPSEEKTLIFVGDKWGHIGAWDVNSKEGQDGVYLYEPHSRPINCMKFSPSDPSKLYSCSYDGTIRCGDLNKEIFLETFSSQEDFGIRYNAFSFCRDRVYSLLVADSDGDCNLLDLRTGKMEKTVNLHRKSARSIDCHPINGNLFASCGFDGEIALWDLRKLTGPKSKLDYGQAAKSVTSVCFSPLTGNKLLSTSNDDYIRIHSILNDTSFQATPEIRIRHNNQTGRWLSKFRATWDPKTDNCFVIGSMARPRQIDIFSADNQGSLIYSLTGENMTSVNSIIEWHPTKSILAGGNSSGRIFLWD